MERKPNKRTILLFPNYFKKVGIIVMIATLVALIILKLQNITSLSLYKEIIKTTAANAFILGLFFIAMAKDKNEDERTLLIRLSAMASSFIAVVIYVILVSSIELFIKDMPPESIHRLVGFMLFTYLLSYYSRKEIM